MLKIEIEKKKYSIKKGQQKPKSTWLTNKTRYLGHKIMITSQKENKKNNNKIQFSINSILKNKIEEKKLIRKGTKKDPS